MSLPTPPQVPESASKPVRAAGIVLGSLISIDAVLIVTPGINHWVLFGVTVAIAGLSGALARQVQQVTTPWKDVGSKVGPDGQMVSGPATKSVAPGTPVMVVKDESGGSVYTPPSVL